MPKPSDAKLAVELAVLDGLTSPVLEETIRVGQACCSPMEPGGLGSAPVKVAEIVRHGNNAEVRREDGSYFELIGCPIVFVYRKNPLRIPMTPTEISAAGRRAWQIELRGKLEDSVMEEHRMAMSRAKLHNQLHMIAEVTNLLRENHRRDKAVERLAGIRDDDNNVISEETIEEIVSDPTTADQADIAGAILDGVQSGD